MADWQRVKSFFEELIELPGDRRDEWLDRACAGDSELRAAVLQLLAAHEEAGDFLASPTLGRGGVDADDGIGRFPQRLPARIGSYTPLEVLGEGGFGTVYRARQDAPVRRIVALKVIKAGMDTREVIARFESERQALAMMSHPNIAAVLDAGATEQGRPYFVMEFVPGEPITTYCDRHRLGLPERLRLFIQVCHAVQHAHQKGIIHRDIKPGNVLVVDEAAGENVETSKHRNGEMPGIVLPQPPAPPGDGLRHTPAITKVIDFGVAKATGQRLTEHSIMTLDGVLIGTPEYMSPEQAEPGQLDIDTRTDIYTLGVLLYELLTGTLPFSSRTLRGKGFAEIQRIVRETEPPRPSLRLSAIVRANDRGVREAGLGDSRATSPDSRWPSHESPKEIARRRRTDPRTLIRHLRGDLDWIVMKCIEKERTRRYETANGVALEVERYLSHEPVHAGPPGAGYRLRKFTRRNRAALAAAAGIAAALAVGLAVSIVGFVAAVTSAEEARRAAEKAEAVNHFLQDTLSQADPKYSARRAMTVREALDRAVARLDAGAMKGEPDIEAAIRLTIGRSYLGLAQFAAAEGQIEAAVQASRQLRGDTSVEYAEALQQRGTLRKYTGRPREAESDFRAALAVQRSRGEIGAAAAATCANDLSISLLDQGQSAEGESLLREVLSFARRNPGGEGTTLAEAVNNLGSLHLARQEFVEAEPLFREAIEVNRRHVGRVHPNVATNLDNLAQTLQGQGDLEGAQAAFDEALAIRRQLFGSEHPDVATTLHNLAGLHYTRGDLAGCELALREALAILRQTHGLAHPDTLTVMDSLVSIVGGNGQLEEAERLLVEAFDAVRDSPLIDTPRKRALALRLAELYRVWKKTDLAAEWSGRADALLPTDPASEQAAPSSATTRPSETPPKPPRH